MLVRVAGGVIGLVVLLALAAALTTGKDTVPLTRLNSPGAAKAPAWSRPCWRPESGRARYTLPCARVRGRVVYREGHDPDGDGDRHLVVISGLGLVTLKIPKDDGPIDLPGYGRRITAVGRYAAGSGQLGVDVVDVAVIE